MPHQLPEQKLRWLRNIKQCHGITKVFVVITIKYAEPFYMNCLFQVYMRYKQYHF